MAALHIADGQPVFVYFTADWCVSCKVNERVALATDTVAEAFDERGKQRLERALVELEPLLTKKTPSYAALFCKGRCLELLFRPSIRYDGLSLTRSARLYQQREQEVREPFLAISARDVTKGGERAELDILGPWGTAAQAAVEHFRWINVHGDYEPVTPIGSLTWPGEKKQ